MKINWNQKYTTIAVYSFIVIASSIIFFLILSGLDRFNQVLGGYVSVLYPFIYGFFIAYLVNFPLKLFTKLLNKIKLLKNAKKSVVHMLALILSYIVSAFLVYLFFAFILPQLILSITGLVRNIPGYVRDTTRFIEGIIRDYNIPPDIVSFIEDRWDDTAKSINESATGLLPAVLSFLRNTAQQFFNLFLAIFISVYLLAQKDYFISLIKKINYGIFGLSIADRIVSIGRRSNNIFGNFLGGKILDSAIIGVLTFIVLYIVNMPYALLVSFIVGVTNIIPFFGPFIGAIPSFIIILFESPVKALWFLLIIFLIQQLDGNVIGPKILGNSLGISAFWILFSVMVSGKFFGVIGMVLGVPLFVLIYSIVKEIMESRLKSKGLPTETEEYLDK